MPYISDDPSKHDELNTFPGFLHNVINEKEFQQLEQKWVKEISHVKAHVMQTLCHKNKEFYEYLINWLDANIKMSNKIWTS